ncbi:hypothetical protein TSOC_001270 [Tetrabaena socialis]|uniref:FAS1 domain-containing protein n=1 Tax=Tetrabaena socialis TaxID=47790 RepID=A0A2J8AH55_9CHLO|nr:hypothetical protein TSOC_001270 [Tetrabaena socialis]|eukprot:PNH11847.1 hypothetical protein TSOC_001270 [Tetrabaena socialis]
MMLKTSTASRLSRPARATRARTVSVRAASIVDAARAKGHTSFADAVEKAGLASTLSDSSASYTVFVPTNAAFAAYDPTDPFTKEPISLKDTLLYHVVKGKTQGRHLGNAANIGCLSDKKYGASAGPLIQVNTRAKKGSLMLGSPAQGTQGLAGLPMGGFVIEMDIPADNGVIHVVDGVFRPQTPLPGNNGSGSAGKSASW